MMNDAHTDAPPPISVLPRHEVRALLRKERRRVRFDAAIALVLTLSFGWIYAQIVRGAGAPPHWIGLTAVGVQLVTFSLAMWARPSDYFMKRRPL